MFTKAISYDTLPEESTLNKTTLRRIKIESFLVNIGIFVVLAFFMGLTFLLPLTVAYTVALIYLMKVGVVGYFLAGPGGTMISFYAWVVIILFEIVYLEKIRFKK